MPACNDVIIPSLNAENHGMHLIFPVSLSEYQNIVHFGTYIYISN